MIFIIMSKVITLSESELIGLVKRIISENTMNLDFYTNEDLMDIYFTLFKDWMSKNVDEKYKKYPMSYLLQKFSSKFETETAGISERPSYELGTLNIYRLKNYIRERLRRGDYTLPSMQSDQKFTEKYKRYIGDYVDDLNLPDYIHLDFDELEPNDINIRPTIDFNKMIRSNDAKNLDHHRFTREFKDFFRGFLGVEFGNPKHGEVQLSTSEPQYKGFDEWVKNEFNKKIKKGIKALPIGKISIEY